MKQLLFVNVEFSIYNSLKYQNLSIHLQAKEDTLL